MTTLAFIMFDGAGGALGGWAAGRLYQVPSQLQQVSPKTFSCQQCFLSCAFVSKLVAGADEQ